MPVSARRATPRLGVYVVSAVMLLVAPSVADGGEASRPFFDATFVVEETPDLVYGSAVPLVGEQVPVDLHLDLYEPAGDPSSRRPAVVLAHGGGFCGGTRTSGRIVQQARHLAARGWVAVSIEYRVNPNQCDSVQAIAAATWDARAAVRWMRANATSLGVDASRIAISGYSAGAFIALGVAYGGPPGTSGTPGWSSDVAAAISHAGAWFGPAPADVPPVQIVHGDADARVPFVWGTGACAAVRAAGRTCEMVTHEGVGHGLPTATIIPDAADFLRRCVAAHAGFPDVPLGGTSDLEPAVGWMALHGITTGYSDGRFHHERVLNRHQLATFLWRLAGEPPPSSSTSFPDVSATQPYADAVAWFAETGITQGYPDGRFGPGRTVTRHQLATFLWRAAGEPAPTGDEPAFPDVPAHLTYEPAVRWLAETGITQGYADGTFRPANPVNRLQASQMLWRLGRTDLAWDGPMARPAASCTNVDLTR
jgi:acetyl esterase/lipase